MTLHLLSVHAAAAFSPAHPGLLAPRMTSAVTRVTAVHAVSVDPFLDPVFTAGASAAAGTASAAAPSGVFSHGSLMFGLACYAITMVFLTWWDERMLPTLQDEGILPELPSSLRSQRLKTLSKEER